MPKDVSAARAHGVLIGKKLNKCTLSILVSNLFLVGKAMQYFHILVT